MKLAINFQGGIDLFLKWLIDLIYGFTAGMTPIANTEQMQALETFAAIN